MITAHLGNGSSLAAIDGGKVIDTSMGLTPLEGLVMGTRSGDLDPAIVPLIGSKLKLTPEQADEFLNKKSGFAGMTGYSDMRDIQRERQAGNPRAQEAYDLFIYRITKYIGAYTAALKGLDVLVFTAGIGKTTGRRGPTSVGIGVLRGQARLRQKRAAAGRDHPKPS